MTDVRVPETDPFDSAAAERDDQQRQRPGSAAGGAACGDLIRVSIALDPDSPDGRITDAGFDASGCGASTPPRPAASCSRETAYRSAPSRRLPT